MKKLFFLLIIIFPSLINVQAQNQQTVDSLLTILNTAPDDTNKIDLLLTIGNENEQMQPDKSVFFYKQALEVAKQISDSVFESKCLEHLGIVYQNGLAKSDSAEVYFMKCIKIRKEIFGNKNTLYASSLCNLAFLYKWMGNFPAAEPLYIEAKKIDRESLGEKHPDYAVDLNNLGELYRAMGNFNSAEDLFIEAMNICKEVIGEKNLFYAVCLNNLAILYQKMGEYARAEPLLIESKNIRKLILGEKNSSYATSLNNLATFYKDIGNYPSAQLLYVESKNIYKEVYGEKHPSYAHCLNKLGVLYNLMGNYKASEQMLIDAMNIRKEVLGQEHPDYASSLFNLAVLYQSMGEYTNAEPLFLEGIEKMNKAINQNFDFLSEKEKEMYINTKTEYFTNFYAFSLLRKFKNPNITQTVYDNIITYKCMLLNSTNSMRTNILNSKDTVLVFLYIKWIDLKKEISKLYSTEISKRKKDPVILEQQANDLEKELVRGSQAFNDYTNAMNMKWEDVQKSLRKDEVAVEFVRINCEISLKDNPIKIDTITNSKGIRDSVVYKKAKSDSVIYAALIVRPEYKSPKMISLFNENQLEEILNKMVSNRGVQILDQPVTKEKSRELYDLIWLPLDSLLKGVKTVYYSPAGLLFNVSFAAMASPENKFLFDEYNLKAINCTRDIISQSKPMFVKPDFNCSIYGGIQYSLDANKLITNAKKYKANEEVDLIAYNDKADLKDIKRGGEWNYLSGTLTEAEAIQKEFQNFKIPSTLCLGENAVEESFKSLSSKSPAIIHIATHGFYFADNSSKNNNFEAGKNFKNNPNPLFRSGLLMAGANRTWTGNKAIEGIDDGILTAYEVSMLDLSNTKLVVLSACETGLGDIRGSEGVYGLQRAFKMAGVKYIIMTLWEIRDDVTVEFMSIFYKQWLKGKEIYVAFKYAQDEMRKKYEANYWAAFVLVE